MKKERSNRTRGKRKGGKTKLGKTMKKRINKSADVEGGVKKTEIMGSGKESSAEWRRAENKTKRTQTVEGKVKRGL